ncbi:hypothetical protein C8Q72DRAFT_854382 [Fomitopsis betulina]|nr:hypothetical protein C8Q72DRAFT_854382 [Fomitopsis betulina]
MPHERVNKRRTADVAHALPSRAGSKRPTATEDHAPPIDGRLQQHHKNVAGAMRMGLGREGGIAVSMARRAGSSDLLDDRPRYLPEHARSRRQKTGNVKCEREQLPTIVHPSFSSHPHALERPPGLSNIPRGPVVKRQAQHHVACGTCNCVPIGHRMCLCAPGRQERLQRRQECHWSHGEGSGAAREGGSGSQCR